jgi:hypothetical protein
MEHPSVTIIGHLSTRLLGQRPPTDFDLESVLHAARDTGTALEINASPERLDLKDTHAFRARELASPWSSVLTHITTPTCPADALALPWPAALGANPDTSSTHCRWNNSSGSSPLPSHSA